MITQFGYFLYFIGKNYLLWNSVETHGILWFLYYYLETFYWTYLMEVSTSFLLITNDWKSGGRCFLNVLFDFKERCLWHALFSYCFYHVLLTGFKSKFCNYLRVANSALSLLLFSL
jgi:hypothetical protein